MKTKHKRISRKELKQKIKTLESRISFLTYEKESMRSQRDKYAKRLDYLGSEGWRQLDISRVEIKPEPWGKYCILPQELDLNAEIIDEIKSRLVKDIASGLMESGMVQIIVHDGDIFYDKKTVGAKLFVVPWEKTVIGRVGE